MPQWISQIRTTNPGRLEAQPYFAKPEPSIVSCCHRPFVGVGGSAACDTMLGNARNRHRFFSRNTVNSVPKVQWANLANAPLRSPMIFNQKLSIG